MVGYSRTPLAQKLGFAQKMRMLLIHPPENYEDLLGDIPNTIIEFYAPGQLEIFPLGERDEQLIHFFSVDRTELDDVFPELKNALATDGTLWISWPKKSSGVSTDITENIVREIGLKNGLVDVKICAVDEIWSGLKFVYRLADRGELGSKRT